MMANYVVSVVMTKQHSTGFKTKNKLYYVTASSTEEAHGKILHIAMKEFSDYNFHTICSYELGVDE